MSCRFTVTLGQDPDHPIDLGETINRIFRYSDDGGPIDLHDATASVLASDPPFIKEKAVITIEEDDDGTFVLFRLNHTDSALLRRQGTNWFRLFVDFGDGSDDATPEIRIAVR